MSSLEIFIAVKQVFHYRIGTENIFIVMIIRGRLIKIKKWLSIDNSKPKN